ncbi:unnamed protein product [Rhizopus stolonifer]
MSIAASKQFLPFPVADRSFKIKSSQYSTSQDPRGCIPVFEYEINGQPIMWDRENGHVHFTGIWKALNNSKADIVKIVDSNQELKVKKVRGGCLVIQGTWIPHEHAFSLCSRTAWDIRYELVPIFGPSFLEAVLPPGNRLHGCLVLNPLTSGSHKVVAAKPKKMLVSPKHSGSHIYKKDSARVSRRAKAPSMVKKRGTITASMSVSRLLNDEEERTPPMVPDNTPLSSCVRTPSASYSPPFVRVTPVSGSSSIFSPSCDRRDSFCRAFTSPSMRVVPTHDSFHSRNQVFPAPMPEITAIFETETEESIHPALSAPLSPQDVDIIERVEAGIRLQCLSQNFGRNPNHPLDLTAFPTKVKAGDNVYKVLWDF